MKLVRLSIPSLQPDHVCFVNFRNAYTQCLLFIDRVRYSLLHHWNEVC